MRSLTLTMGTRKLTTRPLGDGPRLGDMDTPRPTPSILLTAPEARSTGLLGPRVRTVVSLRSVLLRLLGLFYDRLKLSPFAIHGSFSTSTGGSGVVTSQTGPR